MITDPKKECFYLQFSCIYKKIIYFVYKPCLNVVYILVINLKIVHYFIRMKNIGEICQDELILIVKYLPVKFVYKNLFLPSFFVLSNDQWCSFLTVS